MKKNKYHQKIQTKKNGGVKKNIFSLFVLVILFFISMYSYRCAFEKVCGSTSINKFVRHSVTIATPHGVIKAEVADTKSSRELGLSGKSSLGDDEGLLFIFDTPGRYGFWMKDMIFPLDIIWINNEGVVVEVERNIKPESYPSTYINKSPAIYVLELNAGVAEKQGVYIGSKVKILE